MSRVFKSGVHICPSQIACDGVSIPVAMPICKACKTKQAARDKAKKLAEQPLRGEKLLDYEETRVRK